MKCLVNQCHSTRYNVWFSICKMLLLSDSFWFSMGQLKITYHSNSKGSKAFFGPLQTHSAKTDIGTQKHTHMKTHTYRHTEAHTYTHTHEYTHVLKKWNSKNVLGLWVSAAQWLCCSSMKITQINPVLK